MNRFFLKNIIKQIERISSDNHKSKDRNIAVKEHGWPDRLTAIAAVIGIFLSTWATCENRLQFNKNYQQTKEALAINKKSVEYAEENFRYQVKKDSNEQERIKVENQQKEKEYRQRQIEFEKNFELSQAHIQALKDQLEEQQRVNQPYLHFSYELDSVSTEIVFHPTVKNLGNLPAYVHWIPYNISGSQRNHIYAGDFFVNTNIVKGEAYYGAPSIRILVKSLEGISYGYFTTIFYYTLPDNSISRMEECVKIILQPNNTVIFAPAAPFEKNQLIRSFNANHEYFDDDYKILHELYLKKQLK